MKPAQSTAQIEAICDCNHGDDAHAVPGTFPGGTAGERWCSECSCTRFQPDLENADDR